MAKSRKSTTPPPMESTQSSSPSKALVFVSHDSGDADLAEAFGKLLHGVTAGMLRSFRSSDKTGTQGLEYGSEWYSEIMKRIDEASDVVCLLTPRSYERPWILYEAGVAKGKLGTPVHGLVLGMPMSHVTGNGPFGQFQNCSGEPDNVAGLVIQLAKRVPGCDPAKDIVDSQVKAFLAAAAPLTKAASGKKESPRKAEEDIAAKLFEEIKVMFKELPQQIVSQVTDGFDSRRRSRRERPRGMLMEHVRFLTHSHLDPEASWLMVIGLLRDDAPWLYELGMRVYTTAQQGSSSEVHQAIEGFREALHMTMRGPLGCELVDDPDALMMLEDAAMRAGERLVSRRPARARIRLSDMQKQNRK